MSNCVLDTVCVGIDLAPTSPMWTDEVGRQSSTAVLRAAGVPDLNTDHKLQVSFPVFALPQSRSYRLHNEMKGKIQMVLFTLQTIKKGSCGITLMASPHKCVLLGFMSSPYDETF